MKKRLITYVLIAVVSGLILYFWHNFATDGAEIFKHSVDEAKAKIVSVDSKDVTTFGDFESTIIICKAKILSGKQKGETVKVYQEHNSQMPNLKIIENGDKVVIKNYPRPDLGIDWAVDNYLRTPVIWWLIGIFAFLIILLGKTKGLRTVISLLYTCIAVFSVFIPSVLSGKNIYLSSALVCVFIITMTLLMVNGFDKKTLCASLGCIGGVMAAAVISIVLSRTMKFSGYIDEHSIYLTMLPHPVDLNAIAFAAIIIGAVGAVMDVAMSMSSSLYELKVKLPDITFGSLVSSGFEIGKDMMGTMANTLVLAYVGSSVCSVLLLLTYADSAMDLLNREVIANEILQAIAGSIGILLTIPVTALVCGAFYVKRNVSKDAESQDAAQKEDEPVLEYSSAYREKIAYHKENIKENLQKKYKGFKEFFAKNRLK
ncbi:MAG: YibE/F family protein [Clostridia bacterium]|nr:YibE/F family protein [Clostridia bacterium]